MSTTAVIVSANVATLLLGGLVTVLAWRAYRRTAAPPLRALAVGIGLVTLGTAIGGLLHQLTTADLLTGVAIQSVFVAAGFAALVYSLVQPGVPSSVELTPPRR